jgi:hypothetical protein
MPVVAGSFYEGEESLLRERIESCFKSELGPGELPQGSPGNKRTLKAAIAPHAGYVYSGPPAAHTYLEMFNDGRPDHIVILGPNHTGFGARLAVCEEDWMTPLGKVKYDSELGRAIIEENEYATSDCLAHNNEHSIEVQLPFLQYIFPDELSFVPICVSDQKWEICESIGETIANLSKDMDILVLTRSDITHHEPADVAKKKDNQAMEYLEYMDPKGFLQFVQDHRISICGAGPIAAALQYANEMEATGFELLKYTNSGDVLGDHKSVVAYVSAAFR